MSGILDIMVEADSLVAAKHQAYAALINLLDWPGGVYRYDGRYLRVGNETRQEFE